MAQVTYIEDFQIQWMVVQWQLINSTCFKLKFKTIWFFFGQQCIDMSPIFVNEHKEIKKKLMQYFNGTTGNCRNK